MLTFFNILRVSCVCAEALILCLLMVAVIGCVVGQIELFMVTEVRRPAMVSLLEKLSAMLTELICDVL